MLRPSDAAIEPTVFVERPPLVEGLRPRSLADALVAAVVLRGACPALIQPEGDGATIHVKRGSLTLAAFRVPVDVGNAVVARLAHMAELDPLVASTSFERQGNVAKVHFAVAGRRAPVLIGVGATPEGLEAELFPIGATPSLAPPSGGGLKRCLLCGTWQPAPRETCEEDGGPLTPIADDATVGGAIGPYRVVRRLGDGAMGSVLEAEHVLIGRRVAVKILHDDAPPSSSRGIDARRFVAEARAATRVRHPNVVEVTDYGLLSDGRPFMVMELVAGRSLHHLIDEEGPLPPALVLKLGREIALGLAAIHRAGVLHNDLKPSNVMVLSTGDESPQLKIVDFGAALTTEAATVGEESIVGTPAYMAPERARGAPFDGRADIYALGIMLHEMLSGEPPFGGDSPRGVLRAQVRDPPPEPTSELGPLPTPIVALIRKALSKAPESRFQSATEMALEMDGALAKLARAGWRRWLP